MPIEYSPPGLEQLLKQSYAEKRLKNRDGQAYCQNCDWRVESDQTGKAIVDIYRAASKHQEENPEHEIKLFEDTCGTISVTSQRSRKE